MKKQKENLFAEKFHLLNSQESHDIMWTSSESSDNENVSSNVDKLCNITNKKNRKRKRKQTVPKNISNLDVTVVDVQDSKIPTRKIDFIENPAVKTNVGDEGSKSPILGSTQYLSPYTYKNISTSPIIALKSIENQSKVITSPIIVLKTASPKISPNVRKKLFKSEKITIHQEVLNALSDKPSYINKTYCLDRRKDNNQLNYNQKPPTSDKKQENPIKIYHNQHNSDVNNKITLIKHELSTQISNVSDNDDIEILETQHNTHITCINKTPELNDSVSMLKTSSIDLAKKVKNYFDCQFSSENASQNTISEVSTPANNSRSSDDIEINSITQIPSNRNSMESIKSEIDVEVKKEKKIHYKKNGLAYRLNSLIKKQTASISLWHHERFLAANSNFFIPKGEFVAFRICKVYFKYGCHLLEAMDIRDDNFVILINTRFVTTDILSPDCIIKLYEPYKIIDISHHCKYVINVVKFECVSIK